MVIFGLPPATIVAHEEKDNTTHAANTAILISFFIINNFK
jgi:hypothetical protein